jgi:ABC-type transport system involved in multi-copper enzyme maturation permease subunit
MQTILLWLWRLVPANPLTVRIVQGGSRRLRHLWVRMGYLAALIALVLFGLLSGGGFGQQVNLTDLAKAGAWVFAIVAYGQVILVCLLAPLFMAGAIRSTENDQAYDILLTTPLSNLQVVLGSLVGRLFFVLTLILSGLPLFSVLLIFGGVPISSVFVSFAVAGLAALLLGAMAVTLSVLRIGGKKAVFVFVIAVVAYLVAAYAVDLLLLRQLGAAGETTWLTPLHPLLVMEASFSSQYQAPDLTALGGLWGPLAWYLANPFAAFATLSLTLSGVLTVGSAVVLRRVGQGESQTLHWLKRKMRLGDDGAERRHAAREVWHNPIAWREANTRGKVASGIFARWGFAAIGLAAGGALLWLYHTDRLPQITGPAGQPLSDATVLHQGLLALLLLEVAVVALVALYMSAGAVSREREDGTLDLLLTTPITPRQYLWGKLRGLVSFLLLLIAVPVVTLAMVSGYALVGDALAMERATFLHSQMVSGGGKISREPLLLLPEAPLLAAGMLVPFVALCVTVGMNWSLKARSVMGAVVPSVGIMALVALVLGFCGWNAAGSIAVVGPIINAFSPATNLAMLIDPWSRVSDFAQSPTMGRVSLVFGVLIAGGGYSLLVYTMIVNMVRGFDHTVRQLSGTG